MKKTLSILLAVFILALSAAAFAEGDVQKIKIGATPVPHADVLEFIKPLMLEKGFEIEVVVFNDYVLPNSSVEDDSLEANYFQHINYMNTFNDEQGTHLVAAIPVHFEPMGVFKGKGESLEDIQDGAVIGIPNDTSNGARALQLLEAQGLITLDPESGVTATKLDIVTNEKDIVIEEVEAVQLPRMLQDFDFAVINGNYALDAGLSLIDDAVAAEDSDAKVYAGAVNYIVVKEGNEEADFVVALREVLADEATAQFMTDTYKGAVILALDSEAPAAE